MRSPRRRSRSPRAAAAPRESDADKFAQHGGAAGEDADGSGRHGREAADGDEGTAHLRRVATSPTKPKIPKAAGAAPKALKVEDLIEGKGAAAKSGDKVSVRYVGVLFNNNKEFDSSWKRGKAPFELTLGQGQVIAGWDQGLVGMKVGGRRRLTIPPDLAYGAQGQPPTIPANSTLVFDVDMTKIG